MQTFLKWDLTCIFFFLFVRCHKRRGRRGLPQLWGCVVTLLRSLCASCFPSQTFFGTAEDRFYLKASATKISLSGEVLDDSRHKSSSLMLPAKRKKKNCCIITSQASEMSTDIDNGKRLVDSYSELDFFFKCLER